MTVTVTNTGSAPLALTGRAALTGTNPGQFTITANGCPGAGQQLLMGRSCTVKVSFKPTSLGAKSAGLRFADDAAGHPHTIALTGRGV